MSRYAGKLSFRWLGVRESTLTTTEWPAWVELFDTFVRRPRDGLVCPHCGARTIQHWFFVGAWRLGRGAIWCETCQRGLHVLGVRVPANVDATPIWSGNAIPTFKAVTPNPEDPQEREHLGYIWVDTEPEPEYLRVREYVGYIWIGDEPGIRLSLWARSHEDAQAQVDEDYGEGHFILLTNEEDSSRLR